jgi:HEPN domain-containing protein
MSSEEQADAYIEEAELTMESAKAIYDSAQETGEELWAQVVKNGYDAIEQAISASIAAENEAIPRSHPGKINTFIELYEPPEKMEDLLLRWLRRRSSSQYVDIRGDKVNVPHEQFDREDAEQILEDAETVLEYVKEQVISSHE